MVLPITKYGDPILRQKGQRIEKITPEILGLIDDMFETMDAARGIGLAAQQVGKALQLAIVDVAGIEDRPSTLELKGKTSDVEEFMPLVLINPVITALGESVPGPEGCLSFPEMYGEISRPELIEVKATNYKGKPFEFRCGGLLARAIQHENDHLHGILFIDRMLRSDKSKLQEELDELQATTKAALSKKKKS